jgi:hypothetical protein
MFDEKVEARCNARAQLDGVPISIAPVAQKETGPEKEQKRRVGDWVLVK